MISLCEKKIVKLVNNQSDIYMVYFKILYENIVIKCK